MTMHATLRSLCTRRTLALALATFVALEQPLSALAAAPSTRVAKDIPAGPSPLNNSYTPFVGEAFFLLSDATFGSSDQAKVRIEINSPEALAQVGGVDVLVYRIADPLTFLQRQKNLHRVVIDPRPREEGLANTLTHLWDSWVVKARLAWRQLFADNARRAVVSKAPELKTPQALTQPSTFEAPPQFKPIAGLPVVERFRYPVQAAKPIEHPAGLKLAGSSSEFINPSQGNVWVPIGQRAPGLYLVEAIAGQYRATTLVFVSDTVAVTKVSGDQMLVWAAQRGNGTPVPKTQVLWTDGLGVLKSGSADARGVASFDRKAPEQTYVFGQDPSGGVFISENFYYDSEIYTAKVYTITDRPLYRPGDTVHVKATGREFRNARDSVRLKDADVTLTMLDPAGQVVATQTAKFSGATGAAASMALPDNASAGGYELRLAMEGEVYSSAFRVAEYQKPHFEIVLSPDKADFVTGETVSGKLQLNYPDGKPVVNARVSLMARAQKLTMVEGELDFAGQFPIKLQQNELLTDSSGVAKFSLPAADQPSRFILTALATDGAAYRVRASKEVLIERSGGSYKLVPDRQFSKPGEVVRFTLSASQRTAGAPPAQPVRWEAVRLENREKATGAIPTGSSLSIPFAQPGSYTVTLRDERGRVVGGTSHWVSGDGLKAPAGSITMVLDRTTYRAGDKAEVLLSFPEPIDSALLTLERDRVEAIAVLGQTADWISSERIAPNQWKLVVPVREAMSPNMTLSVAYVKNGDYFFENQGLRVEQARIDLTFKTDKPVYAPGETVTVNVATMLAGKPVSAELAVGVVDEMVYVLQPEIAPSIEEFFYHPRRNNVRTSASLSFIGYDLATSKLGVMPSSRQVNQRAVKVLERPRRDNVDTAAWVPSLKTDATGRAQFSFKMPDSLTRWRITARAIEGNGTVGQQTTWIRSDKPFYAKWTSPNWQRTGDRAQTSVALFNQTPKDAKLEWEVRGSGVEHKATITARPGINFFTVPLTAPKDGAVNLALTVRQDGKIVDQLDTTVQRLPVAWRAPRAQTVDISSGSAVLNLPADATRVRVSFAQDRAAGEFNRLMEELIDFPYGCVEQTASRLLPLSMALQSLSPAQQSLAPMLTQRLSSARLSLAQMAGPNARFGWWGRGMAADPFVTAYAYYADWRASQVLRTPLPAEHWQRLLTIYSKEGLPGPQTAGMPPLQRALTLSWMQEMGLPIGSMLSLLIEQLTAQSRLASAPQGDSRGSLAMVDGPAPHSIDVALVLAIHTANLAKLSISADPVAAAAAAASRLAGHRSPFVQALLMASGRAPADQAGAVLAQVSANMPTFDRAQTLAWLQRALGRKAEARGPAPELAAPWQRIQSASGEAVWQLPIGAAVPPTLVLPAGAQASLAFVSYESNESQAPELPVTVERTLWRVVTVPSAVSATGQPVPAGVENPDSGRLNARLEAVAPGTPLDTNTLYLDQIKVRSSHAMRWALVEAALPPGAAVESSTWGISLGEGQQAQPLERAQHQPTAQGYAVPIDKLASGSPLTMRHLVRFSQRGQFKLPPTRIHRMYDPEAKGFDASGQWLTVEVR